MQKENGVKFLFTLDRAAMTHFTYVGYTLTLINSFTSWLYNSLAHCFLIPHLIHCFETVKYYYAQHSYESPYL